MATSRSTSSAATCRSANLSSTYDNCTGARHPLEYGGTALTKR